MKVIIIGGGIGGCTTAIALEHMGITAHVYEAAPALNEVGAGLWVAPNAMAIYDTLGLAQEIQEHGAAYTAGVGLGGLNGHLFNMMDGAVTHERYGHHVTAIHRASLQSILTRRVSNLHLGKRAASIDLTDDAVSVRFEDGSISTADALIGADGIHSTVRQQLIGDVSYRYSGQTCWRFVVPFELPEHEQKRMIERWGDVPGQRAAFGEIGSGQVYVYLSMCAEPEDADDPATLKAHLLRVYEAFSPTLLKLIDAVPVYDILRHDLYDFEPIHRWHGDRVVLVGDAAHATTPNLGQGACQAVESAYALSKSLARSLAESPDHADVITRAFERYQNQRITKAHWVTRTSWQMGQVVNLANPMLRALRNVAMTYTPAFYTRRIMDKIYRIEL